jgi:hypothetical protein
MQMFSTKDAAAGQRFAYWVDMICATYVKLKREPMRGTDCFGEVRSLYLDGMAMSSVEANVPLVRRTPRQINAGSDRFIFVHLCHTGTAPVRQQAAGRRPQRSTVCRRSRHPEQRSLRIAVRRALRHARAARATPRFVCTSAHLHNLNGLTCLRVGAQRSGWLHLAGPAGSEPPRPDQCRAVASACERDCYRPGASGTPVTSARSSAPTTAWRRATGCACMPRSAKPLGCPPLR